MTGRLRTETGSTAETLAVAETIGELFRPGDVVVLAGDLGSGKTTFAKGVGRALAVAEPVVSPTFTIVRQYEGRLRLVHVDVYRLDHLQELHDLGLEELIDGDAVTLVEWGDVVTAYLPTERLEIRLDVGGRDDDRVVTLVPRGPSWLAREGALAAALDDTGPAAATG
jgi:tRNA threonylcarbamoyladenosine biosynthesis protein TsaE